jgi:hypothetical protein
MSGRETGLRVNGASGPFRTNPQPAVPTFSI